MNWLIKRYLKKGFFIATSAFILDINRLKVEAVNSGYVPGTAEYYGFFMCIYLMNILLWPLILVKSIITLIGNINKI